MWKLPFSRPTSIRQAKNVISSLSISGIYNLFIFSLSRYPKECVQQNFAALRLDQFDFLF